MLIDFKLKWPPHTGSRFPYVKTEGSTFLTDYMINGYKVEPLGGKRKVKITELRTRIDWGHFIKEMLEERYKYAEKVVLVMDNLNTHNTAIFAYGLST